MTEPANGQVPQSELVAVQSGTYAGRAYTIYLETATAAAYNKAAAAGGLTIAAPLGGDRTLQDQINLKNDPPAYGANVPASAIGSPGYSTHGWGTCVDIAANNAWFQAHCGEYGFVRESPAGENNHYRYLSPTWASAAVIEHNLTTDEVKRVATYLNARGLGETTTASTTGINVIPGQNSSNYYKEVQTAGRADGLYPAPAYVINGIPGPKTYAVELHYRDLTAPVLAQFVVTFLPYAGAVPLAAQRVTSGQQASTPPAPSEDGFVFESWSTDGVNQFDWQTPITADTALIGLWTAVVVPPPVDTTPPPIDPPVTPPTDTPVDPTPVEPTKPTPPTKPAKDNWFVAFIKLIASVWVNLDKTKK